MNFHAHHPPSTAPSDGPFDVERRNRGWENSGVVSSSAQVFVQPVDISAPRALFMFVSSNPHAVGRGFIIPPPSHFCRARRAMLLIDFRCSTTIRRCETFIVLNEQSFPFESGARVSSQSIS